LADKSLYLKNGAPKTMTLDDLKH